MSGPFGGHLSGLFGGRDRHAGGHHEHPTGEGGHGRALPPTSPFASDDGSPDPDLRALLADHAAGAADLGDVVAALAGRRVLLPVVAHEAPEDPSRPHPGAGHDTDHALGDERTVETGIAALRAPDGRTALPVFTGVDALTAWSDEARPVPATIEHAAASALAEGWPLIVVDAAGPVTVVVPRPAVQALAAGLAWHPVVRDGVVRPDVCAAIERVVAEVAQVHSVDVEPGRTADVAVVVGLVAGLDRPALEAVLAEVNARLVADPVVAQVDSLELRPVAR